MDKLLAVAFGVLGVFGVLAIVMLISLIFIKIGWAIFIVPVFGLPDLTWMQALGFSFLASAFKSSGIKSKE